MPSDRFFGPLANLKTLIANSATFQTIVGAADAPAALASIVYYSAPGIVEVPRPRALLGSGEGRGITKVSSTGWSASGNDLEFELQRDSDPGDVGDDEAGFVTFFQLVDDMIDEMAALSGSNGFLDVEAFALAGDPLKWSEELNDGSEFWNVIINVTVGGA